MNQLRKEAEKLLTNYTTNCLPLFIQCKLNPKTYDFHKRFKKTKRICREKIVMGYYDYILDTKHNLYEAVWLHLRDHFWSMSHIMELSCVWRSMGYENGNSYQYINEEDCKDMMISFLGLNAT